MYMYIFIYIYIYTTVIKCNIRRVLNDFSAKEDHLPEDWKYET